MRYLPIPTLAVSRSPQGICFLEMTPSPNLLVDIFDMGAGVGWNVEQEGKVKRLFLNS